MSRYGPSSIPPIRGPIILAIMEGRMGTGVGRDGARGVPIPMVRIGGDLLLAETVSAAEGAIWLTQALIHNTFDAFVFAAEFEIFPIMHERFNRILPV